MMIQEPQMTKHQGDLIVKFVKSLRPDWDEAGIRAALRNAYAISSSPTRLMCAAIFAAGTGTNLTPAVIGMRGPHWDSLDPNRSKEPPRPKRRCDRCQEWNCDNGVDCRPAEECADPAAAVAAAKSAIRPTWRPAPKETKDA